MSTITLTAWVPDGQERYVESQLTATMRSLGYQSTLDVMVQGVAAEARRVDHSAAYDEILDSARKQGRLDDRWWEM